MSNLRPLLCACLVVTVAIVAGCSDQTAPESVNPPTDKAAIGDGFWLGTQSPYPEATTPNQLSDRYFAIYANRDHHLLSDLYHDDFQFVRFSDDPLTLAEELHALTAMMSGRSGLGGYAIDNITVDFVEPVTPWMQVADDDEHFGGSGAIYRVQNIRVDHRVAGENLNLQVWGLVLVYAQEDEDGSWKILGIGDQTIGNKTEEHSWSSIRALFL